LIAILLGARFGRLQLVACRHWAIHNDVFHDRWPAIANLHVEHGFAVGAIGHGLLHLHVRGRLLASEGWRRQAAEHRDRPNVALESLEHVPAQ
jgi:hypothetical protein